MPGWNVSKKGAPNDLPPSRELPKSPGSASKLHALFEFQFHAAGTREQQRTPPYPRRSHRRRLPSASPKPTPLVGHSRGQETAPGEDRSNKAQVAGNRTCHPPLTLSGEIR